MNQRRQLSQEEAAALWARAAELQEQARNQSNDLQRSIEAARPDAISQEIAHQAAVESGIDSRFIDSAALQLATEHHLDQPGASGRTSQALGPYETTVTERAVVTGDMSQVRAAVAKVAESGAFSSDPVEIIEHGPHNLALIYEVPQNLKHMFNEDSFHYQVRNASEVRRFAVLISKRDEESCEVSVYCAMHRSIRANAVAMRFVQAFAGVFGGVGGGLLTSALIRGFLMAGSTLGTLTIAIGAAAVGIGLAALAGKGFRAAYRKTHKRLRDSFRKFLTALRMRVSS